MIKGFDLCKLEVIVPDRVITLRGVAVHNLKEIDLDIPHRKLVVLCGLSGSGKTSLALDTLYAEGQRRYIDSFSAYTRQFLERLEKPAAEQIEGIPPAIAVTHKNTSRSSRSTVGTTTETSDYLRLLLAKIGHVFCWQCGQEVRRHTPQTAAEILAQLPEGARYVITFAAEPTSGVQRPLWPAFQEEGFVRVIVGNRLINLTEEPWSEVHDAQAASGLFAVIDRLVAGGASPARLRDSLETAFTKGRGKAYVFVDPRSNERLAALEGPTTYQLDGRPWQQWVFSTEMRCESCGLEYPLPEPRLYSFNSPLGACPECEGFGNIIDIDLDLVVPDPAKSLQEGAIAPWNTPAYVHELQELLALAPDFQLPVDVPYRELSEDRRRLIIEGVPERNFGGLKGFFAWLERRKYKMHLRVFLSRWRSYRPCSACGGARLRREALATRVGGKNIAEISAMKIQDALTFMRDLDLPDWERAIGRIMLDQAQARLKFLVDVGLGYLSLDRTLRTLSGGETQRVSLTSALGSSLVNMLYVLDEPSVGLHPRDIDRLIGAIRSLCDRGNSVVVVEHEESMIRAADQVIEIGPGAGERGGEVVFQGTPVEMLTSPRSITGDFLSGRRGIVPVTKRRAPNHGWIRLAGARGNNLQNITVEFPLGLLCLVTCVSGSGKSTLVEDTLYPGLCRRMRKDAPKPYDYDDVYGDGQLEDVILVDQSPIGRSPRSNPVTYIKAFDEIRSVFAETIEARTRNFDAAHFSFNVDGGRCSACQGDGYIAIDMQFLADVYMKCSACGGRRYRKEILDIKYRGRNIAQVLEMTVREAFTFFRGQTKVQARLKRLIDVGLDYLRLGQPANTLSGGEAQRLKLAAYMSTTRRGRSLFILDEPTTGLHFQDVVQLLDCFEALINVGHSLIVVEHNLQLMKAADYIVDLGPGAADEGGRVVTQGTPEAVARVKESITGRFLAEALAEEQHAAEQRAIAIAEGD
ncbi:MAG: excinuclease ABC subunit UvrA [Planctomycetia bacterium]|nr:excinuclease ABC subunit UvrA [Planctomycetia bacterium]